MRAIASSLSQPLYSTHLHGFTSLALQSTVLSCPEVSWIHCRVCILIDFQRYLNDPDLKLFEPLVRLLCGVAMASDPAAVCVLPQVLPRLLQHYSTTTQVTAWNNDANVSLCEPTSDFT